MISRKKSGFEEKYFKGKESNYFTCLEYKTGNLSYLYKEKICQKIRNYEPRNVRVLDVGCALGNLLALFDKDGFTTYGLDVSEFAIKEAAKRTKAKLIKADVNKGLPFEDNIFNLITGIDVIEHLQSPYNFLLEAKRVLRKDGFLFLQTPNISSLFVKILGNKWFGYQDKTHLYLFNRESLRFLLKQAGFEVLKDEIIFYPAPSFLRPVFGNVNIGGSLWTVAKKT